MRIALLTNFIPPYRKSLYAELSKQIEDFTIFISQEMEKNRNWAVDHGGLKVVVQKGIRYQKKWKGNYGYNEKTIVQIPYDTFFKLRAFKPSIVISSELGIRSLFSALYCKIYRKPLILWLALSEHTEKNKTGLRIFLRRRILKSAHSILCNGESSKRYIQSLGINKPMYFTPCTSDFTIKEHEPKPTNGQVKTLLFSGQLIARKGIKEMVQALTVWSERNASTQIKLVVAGDGAEKVYLDKLNKIENIELECLGTVPYNQLEDLYLTSDLYLFPTLADEWGVVVNEAMASGLPVIGSRYSQAVEELVEVGRSGWIFEPDNEAQFVKILTDAIDTGYEELREMGRNGATTIQNFTPEKVAANIMKAIESSNTNS